MCICRSQPSFSCWKVCHCWQTNLVLIPHLDGTWVGDYEMTMAHSWSQWVWWHGCSKVSGVAWLADARVCYQQTQLAQYFVYVQHGCGTQLKCWGGRGGGGGTRALSAPLVLTLMKVSDQWLSSQKEWALEICCGLRTQVELLANMLVQVWWSYIYCVDLTTGNDIIQLCLLKMYKAFSWKEQT